MIPRVISDSKGTDCDVTAYVTTPTKTTIIATAATTIEIRAPPHEETNELTTVNMVTSNDSNTTILSLDGSNLTSEAIHQRLTAFLSEECDDYAASSSVSCSSPSTATTTTTTTTTTNEDGSDNDNGDNSMTSECCELELRNVDFDPDQASIVVDTIRSLSSSSAPGTNGRQQQHQRRRRRWRRVSIIHCSGLVNDVILACTSHTDLEQFHVQQPVINTQTSFCLLFGMKYNTSLRSLRLSIPLWEDASLSSALAKALARNTVLEELSLEGCVVPKRLRYGGTGNGAVDDNDDDDDDDVVDPAVTTSVRHVSFGLRLNRTLQSLILSGCELTDDHCGMILGALQGHSTLQKLDLQKNACHTHGMEGVAGLLHDSSALRELDLSFLIRPKAKKKTKDAKVQNTSDDQNGDEVKEDDDKEDDGKKDSGEENGEKKDGDTDKMDEVQKSDEGVGEDDPKPNDEEEEQQQRVANSTLEILRLAGNGLGDDFVDSMLSIFVNKKKISKLQELNLFGNRLTNRGLKTIMKKCTYLPNLQLLYLQHNVFLRPLDMKDDLLKFITTNYSLHEFTIYSSLMAITAGGQADPDLQTLQDRLDYYGRLNRTGRRIMTSFAGCRVGKNKPSIVDSVHDDGTNVFPTSDNDTIEHEKKDVPLGLWALIFDRANRRETISEAADIIYYLLHYGPVVLENPNLSN